MPFPPKPLCLPGLSQVLYFLLLPRLRAWASTLTSLARNILVAAAEDQVSTMYRVEGAPPSAAACLPGLSQVLYLLLLPRLRAWAFPLTDTSTGVLGPALRLPERKPKTSAQLLASWLLRAHPYSRRNSLPQASVPLGTGCPPPVPTSAAVTSVSDEGTVGAFAGTVGSARSADREGARTEGVRVTEAEARLAGWL